MRKAVVGFVAIVISFLGCGGPSFQTRVPDASITPTRMLVLPVIVKTYELDASDDRTEHRDEIIQSNIDAAVRAEATSHSIRVFARELDSQDLTVKSLYARLWRWIPRATTEIAAQQRERQDFGRHSVGDWQFPGNLAPLGDALQADTALAVFVSDTGETACRRFVEGMTRSYTSWKRLGAACVISLRDGRMIGCYSRVDAWGNLKNPGVAAAAVGEMFDGLFAPRAGGGGK